MRVQITCYSRFGKETCSHDFEHDNPTVIDVLFNSHCGSKSEIKRLIKQGAIRIYP